MYHSLNIVLKNLYSMKAYSRDSEATGDYIELLYQILMEQVIFYNKHQ